MKTFQPRPSQGGGVFFMNTQENVMSQTQPSPQDAAQKLMEELKRRVNAQLAEQAAKDKDAEKKH